MSIEAPIEKLTLFILTIFDYKIDKSGVEKNINFIVKYKLYHLAFWFAYHYFWWALSSGSIIETMNNIFFSVYSTKFVFYVVFQAFGVYFNLYFLIPKFLKTGKYLIYIPLFITTILVTAFCIIGGYFVNAYVVGVSFEELFFMPPENFMDLFKGNALPSTAASMTLAMSIKLTKNWIASERRRNTIEKEKLETELKFLRSQFNPHFLFNTINSIFVLIHKNQDMASESLAKFSELLRYQLYQCNEPYIALNQELEYLKNYIELEKLRQDSNNLTLQFDIEESTPTSLKIAPFILIPFVENAFKHISHHQESPNWIRMNLKVENNQLKFNISNSTNTFQISTNKDTSGIGLNNVKRRLELLYPQAHSLEVYKDNSQFKVELALKLEEFELIKSKHA